MNCQRVLSFLAINARPLLRQYVAANLWLDSPEDRANANLRSALWRLRRVPAVLVESTSTHLALSPTVTVDLHEALALARGILDGTRDHQTVDVSRFTLFRELLPEWYDEWVVGERERFGQIRVHALELLSEQLISAGLLARAVEAGLTAVAFEPLRESAHRVLIIAYLAEGNRAEAVQQYRAYRDLLQREIGVDPSPQMQNLLTELPGAIDGRRRRDVVVRAESWR